MAVNIDSRLKLQPTDEADADAEGGSALVIEWKGVYAAAKATADTFAAGADLPTVAGGNAHTPNSDLYAGYKIMTWRIRRGNGDTAILSAACTKGDKTEPAQGGGTTTVPIRDVFSLKSVRNDVSLFAYCGTSASNPNRVAIEKWMRETDSSLAREYKYRESDGTEVDIANTPEISYSIPLIKKIEKGIESVIRFYPQLTRRRLYYNPPPDAYENLGYIDTPPTPPSGSIGPTGISTVISDHEWLKVQDDCDEQQDYKWLRTESWIGLPKSDEPEEHPWDPDLYGNQRWSMPAFQPDDQEEQT